MIETWDLPGEDDEPAEAPGLSVGDYDLVEELGRGAMGAVYRAKHRRLAREVALKVILAGQFAGQAERRRFLVEAEAAASLDHPHLVALFEQGEEAGRLFYAMQLVNGPTLAERLKKGPLPSREAAALMAKCARAVHHAHERGVLHRDLKPSNVLLDAAGDPHVADFGLARRLGHDATLTLAGSLVGSPAYMAPEMASGASATAAADVYSLGSMLYEMLGGAPPFVAPTITEVLLALREREPLPLRTKGIDADLESVCLRCLEKDPARRYASALALADDLERWLRGEPVQARLATPLLRLWKWARRRPAIAFLSALVFLLFVGGGAGIAWQWQRAVAQAGRAQAARRLAESREIETRRALYAADMNLAQAALRANNLGRARALLDAYRPAPGELDLRGWEWRYLWGQCRSHALAGLPRAEHPVKGVALSPDGGLAITADDGGHLKIWDTEKLTLVREVRGHGAGGPLAMSPDGKVYIAPLSGESSELRSLLDSRAVCLTSGALTDSSFSRDGSLFAMQDFSGTTRVWNQDGSTKVAELPGDRVLAGHGGAVAFVPGPVLRLATGTTAGKVRLYNTKDWTIEREWNALSGQSTSALAASPDGRWLVSGGCFDDPVLRVWDLTTGLRAANLTGHTSWVSTLLFSRDGNRLYSASADQTIRVWNTADWSENAVLRGHSDEIWSMAISGDGRRLISGSKNGEVLLWSAEPAQMISERFDFPREVTELSDAGDSSDLLATNHGSERTFSRWSPGFWRETRLPVLGDASYKTAGGYFATREHEGIVAFHTSATVPPSKIGTIKTAPFDTLIGDHKGLVLVRKSGAFTLFEPRTQNARELPPLPVGVTTAKIDSLRHRLLALGTDQTIQRYDLAAEKWMTPLSLPPTKGRLFIGRSGEWMVETSGRTVRIFRGEPTVREALSFEAENSASSVAFSPDGCWLAVANEAAIARLWRLESNGTLGPARLLRGHLNAIHGVVFTDDSTRLVTTCSNHEAAKFWDVETGREMLTLPGASTMLYFARFYAHGEVLVGSHQSVGGPWHAWYAPSLDTISREEATK